MKRKSRENQKDSEYTNILIKEIEKGKGNNKKKSDGQFPLRGKIHKRGFRRSP